MTKKYIATLDDKQTLTNKTIKVSGNNTIEGIDVANLATKTAADVGKSFVIKADGTWEINKAVSTPDDVTIENNASDKLQLKDGSETTGITVAKINTTALSTTIPASGEVDTKLPTEKAVKTYVDAFGKSVEFTMDSTTFVQTLKLKDANGNVLTEATVDLPLEQMKILSVTYDNTGEKLIITYVDATGTTQTVELPASAIAKGVVTETASQTLTNKTIDVDNNTVSNIEADNLKDQTASDEDKAFVVKSDGKWEVNYPRQYKRVATLPATGDVKYLYFLTTADATYSVGLYVWDGTSAYTAISKPVTYDNVTISVDSDGKLLVKDAGLTTAKFNSDAIATSISASASAVDTKFVTEKAVATELEKRVPFATGSTSTAFTIGEDAKGYYIEE